MTQKFVSKLLLLCLASGCSEKRSMDGNSPPPEQSAQGAPQQVKPMTNSVSRGTNAPPTQGLEAPQDALNGIQQYPNQNPLPEWIVQLKPDDQKVLLSGYQREPELTNKLSLTISLAFIGDEQVVHEFTRTILKYEKPAVNNDEENVLLFTIEGLGLLARRHDSAFEFLQKAIDPQFWKDNVSWRTDEGQDQYGILAGRSIAALGYSGKAEVEQILQRIKSQPFLPDVDSALLDAAFFRDLLQQRGFDFFKGIYGTEEIFRQYTWWKETENGKQWREWLKEWRKKQPPAHIP